MPELPEVETVRLGLLPHLCGRTITRMDLRRGGLRFPFPEGFAAQTEGRVIRAIDRRGKYLLLRLDEWLVWRVHLGMSGRFTLYPAGTNDIPPAGKHDHVITDLSDGGRAVFSDPRRFGFMDLATEESAETGRGLEKLGPEPLGQDFNGGTLVAALGGRGRNLKAALLDQRVVAGLGNIYICEALWESGLSPLRCSLDTSQAGRLVAAIRDVLTRAIAAGGSSLKDYRQADGQLGYFQHRWRAYGRSGQPCGKPGCRGAILRIVQNGRSSFYCPVHQK